MHPAGMAFAKCYSMQYYVYKRQQHHWQLHQMAYSYLYIFIKHLLHFSDCVSKKFFVVGRWLYIVSTYCHFDTFLPF